jgi:NTP pyrophosphatase (non-canonical NTP hydrolase)
MTLDNYALTCHAIAKEKGFWDDTVDANFILAKLALIASEVSEVLEAYRKEQGSQKIAEEMADIFIRLSDLYAGMQEHNIVDALTSFDEVVGDKVRINANRDRKHGNLI